MSKPTQKKEATKPKEKKPTPQEIITELQDRNDRQSEILKTHNQLLEQVELHKKTITHQRGQIVQLERENVTLAREASKLANIAETATLTAMQAADSLLVVSKDRLDGVRAEIEKSQAAIASAKALRGTNGECEACDTAGIVTGSGKDASLDTYSGGATTTLYRGC